MGQPDGCQLKSAASSIGVPDWLFWAQKSALAEVSHWKLECG